MIEDKGPNISPKDYTILVVDDEPDVRRYFAKILRGKEFIVETAETGRKALEIINTSVIDLVLLDYKMPVMDGLETLKQIKSDEHHSDLPVFMVSAFLDDTKMVIECIKNGAEEQLPKNIDKTILMVKIFACLQKFKMMEHQEVLAEQQSIYLTKIHRSNRLVKNLMKSIQVIKKMMSVSTFVEDTGVNLTVQMDKILTQLDGVKGKGKKDEEKLDQVKHFIENSIMLEAQNFDRIFQQLTNINICIKNMANILDFKPLENQKFSENIFDNLKEK